MSISQIFVTVGAYTERTVECIGCGKVSVLVGSELRDGKLWHKYYCVACDCVTWVKE